MKLTQKIIGGLSKGCSGNKETASDKVYTILNDWRVIRNNN